MPAGRDQTKAMARLVRIMAKLHDAAPASVSRKDLFEVAEYGDEDPGTQLGRDLKHLRQQGWEIENAAPLGDEARYTMVTRDNRLQLRFTPQQRAALQRALMVADRSDLAGRLGVTVPAAAGGARSEVLPHAERGRLTLALQALRMQSRIRFLYKGTMRSVHPAAVRFRHVHWYVSGLDEADGELKHFAVDRMGEVALDAPGSGAAAAEVRRLQLHPLQWEVDPPVEVTLAVDPDHVPDVVRWLQEPHSTLERDGTVEMTYVVTNRSALRARVYSLATRVRVLGPAEFRDELLAELRDLVGL